MNPLNIIKLVIIISIIIASIFWHNNKIDIAVNNTKAQYADKYNADVLRLHQLRVQSETELEAALNKSKETKDAEIKAITRRYNSTIASLYNRPTRDNSSDNSKDTSHTESTKGATGKELYRNDAEFLVGFAADAERLKIELSQCYIQYDEVKETINNYNR